MFLRLWNEIYQFLYSVLYGFSESQMNYFPHQGIALLARYCWWAFYKQRAVPIIVSFDLNPFFALDQSLPAEEMGVCSVMSRLDRLHQIDFCSATPKRLGPCYTAICYDKRANCRSVLPSLRIAYYWVSYLPRTHIVLGKSATFLIFTVALGILYSQVEVTSIKCLFTVKKHHL